MNPNTLLLCRSKSVHLTPPADMPCIPESDSCEKIRSLPKKSPSPKGSRKQLFLKILKTDKPKPVEQVSTDFTETTLTSSQSMTKCTNSLPNLTSRDTKEALGDASEQQSCRSLDYRNGKVKKRMRLFKKNK